MPDSLLIRDGGRTSRLVAPPTTPVELIGQSPTIGRIHELVRRAAALEGAVLLVAEAGVDIESVAHDLHVRSRPPSAPWVTVNCGREGPRLDVTLFGVTNPGDTDLETISSDSLIAKARGGTLFLSDVTELPSSVQARLARVARDGEVRLDGQALVSDLRFVAGALPSIDSEVHDHRFRSDLYRRLAATRIDLPSLRDRPGDVPAFVERVLQDVCANSGPAPRSFTQAAVALLANLTWPGNLAELRGAVERVVAQTRAGVIQVEHVLPALQLERAVMPFIPAGNLREARMRFEREYIAAVLQHHEWRMAEAAQTLGIQRPNLYRKARQLGIPVARATESRELEGIMNLSTLALTFLLINPSQAAGQPAATPPAVATTQANPSGPPATAYRIGLEDEIRLVVDGEDQFNTVFRVQSDGGISLPYLGTVIAQGLTTIELQDRIRRLLIEKDLFRNPQVRAEISKYGSQFVMVQGEVRVPQRLQMTGPMTLMEALAAAGSTTPNASVVVTVARTPVSAPGDPPRDPQKYTIDLRVLYSGVAAANIALMNGDIINVPKAEVFYVQGRVKCE